MKYLAVKNLRKYQHYRDRKPPWIKLYSSVLDDYAFACLQDASKAHAMLIWVLASQYDNKLPWDAKWLGQKIGASDPVDVDVLIGAGFLVEWQADTECKQDASIALADRSESAMPREQRTEKRELHNRARKKPRPGHAQPEYPPEFDSVWAEYPSRAGGNPKRDAFRAWSARRGEGVSAADLQAGVRRYAAFCEASGKLGTEFVMQGARFFGPARPFEEPWAPSKPPGIATLPPDPASAFYAVLRDHGLLHQSRDEFRATVERLVSDGTIPDREEFIARCRRLDFLALRNASAERFAVQHVRERGFAGQEVA